jgi:tight adherence protein C
MEVVAAVAVFATVLMFAMAFLRPRQDAIRARVAALGTPSRTFESPENLPSFGDRILGPVVDALSDRILSLLPHGLLARVRRRLIVAGEPISLEGFLIVCAVAAGIFGGLGLAIAIAMLGTIDAKGLLGIALLAGGGAFLPFFWLRSYIHRRQAGIIKTLPDSFDLVTTCVEAGLGLDAALGRVAEKVKGPFAEELSFTLREISMGRGRSDALRDLGERTGVPDLLMFVNAVIQAEQMGTSIGQVLRVQSDQMRTRRRQRAEELANQAPVKMVFPLVLCIFPTLFIVILGPAVIQLYQTFTQT